MAFSSKMKESISPSLKKIGELVASSKSGITLPKIKRGVKLRFTKKQG